MMKFTSKKLVLNLEGVKSRLTGRKMSARITVPADLDWWFYQEFGTATHFDEEAFEMPPGVTTLPLPNTHSPGGYIIPAAPGKTLRLPVTMHFPDAWEGPAVNHPGVSPKAFIRRILPVIHKKSSEAVAMALVEGKYDPGYVQQVLLTETLPEILVDITDSMALALHSSSDRDTPGKLGSQSPADVFESSATIVDSSG